MNTFIKLLTLGAAVLAVSACGSSRHSTVSATTNSDEVVNIGYGTTSKDANNYATSKVAIKKNEIAAYTSMYDYLRGRVPGVEVTSGNKIIIRGVSTNSGDTDPLILVDGVEVADLSSVNPMDVDDVTVLKDASASIYGVRGGNGVILITLKH